MIVQFMNSLTWLQAVVVGYLVVYLLVYGINYHMQAMYCVVTNKHLVNDWPSITLNWVGYAAMLACLYWFV